MSRHFRVWPQGARGGDKQPYRSGTVAPHLCDVCDVNFGLALGLRASKGRRAACTQGRALWRRAITFKRAAHALIR